MRTNSDLTDQPSLFFSGKSGTKFAKKFKFFQKDPVDLAEDSPSEQLHCFRNIASEIPRNLAPGFTQYFSEEVGLTEAAASTITPNIHCSRSD